MSVREKVAKAKDGGSAVDFGDIDGEERLEDAKEEAALVDEEFLVGVRKRQNDKRAAKNESKIFNNWPQP